MNNPPKSTDKSIFYDFIASWLSKVDSSWQPLSYMRLLAAIIIDSASKTESKTIPKNDSIIEMRDLKLFEQGWKRCQFLDEIRNTTLPKTNCLTFVTIRVARFVIRQICKTGFVQIQIAKAPFDFNLSKHVSFLKHGFSQLP